MRYYQKSAECMPESELRKLQDEKLVKQVQHAWEHVPFYRRKMEKAGVRPEDIQGVKDLPKLPFTTKADLRDTYPDGFLAVDKSKCIRMHSTSGTTGKRVIVYYTKKDLRLWEDCCARALTAAGVTKKDVVQVAFGYGLFTGGFGLHAGSEKKGCLTIPMSSGNTDRQIQFMEDIGTTVLACTPSYAEYLAECIEKAGQPHQLKLKTGIFGAEAWSEEMRKDIQDRLKIKAYDIYGLTELSGPGVAYECSCQDGMHINEDHFIAEIVDPVTLKPLPRGRKGELVFTSLDKEAFPIIRYRTRDITVLKKEACGCGRSFVRMARPMGRSDDMLIIRGVNVFPSQVETVLLEAGCSANYQIVVDRIGSTDSMEVLVEMTPELLDGDFGKITAFEKDLTVRLKDMIGLTAKVKLVAPSSITRSEGKAVRVIDKRKI